MAVMAEQAAERETEAARPWFAGLAGLVALLTVARIAVSAASGLNLSGDEAQYWSWAQTLDWGYFSKPPMVAYLIAAATAACGDGEACVRLPSPLLHGATALVLFLVACRLAGPRAGFWVGLTYASLPAVSLSSQLVSTDVALLFFWSLAMLAYLRLLADAGAAGGALLGLALGLGFLAKYAMVYFFVAVAAHMVVSPPARALLRRPAPWLALAIGGLLIAPNILWNQTHGWATVGHLKANANLGGDIFQPLSGLRFLGEQMGVFGPILFIVLSVAALRLARGQSTATTRFLAAFSLPILAIVTAQALLSRANANWAAAAYPAATIWVVLTLAGGRARRWRQISLGLHGAAMGLLWFGLVAYPAVSPPTARDPLARLHGWPEFADQVAALMARHPAREVVIDDRKIMASLLYYLRAKADTDRLRAWDYDGFPHHHYELTRAYRGTPEHGVILVARWGPRAVRKITDNFAKSRALGDLKTPDQPGREMVLTVRLLDGFQPNKAADNSS